MFDDPKPTDSVNMTVQEFEKWAALEKAARELSEIGYKYSPLEKALFDLDVVLRKKGKRS